MKDTGLRTLWGNLLAYLSKNLVALTNHTAMRPLDVVEVLATGLGILVDDTIIRGPPVASVVVILGEANWWMPRGLATFRRLPTGEVRPRALDG